MSTFCGQSVVAPGGAAQALRRCVYGSGRYNNASEVVRAGLRLLEDTERQQAIQLQALRNDIAAGKASGAALAAEPVFDRLQAKYARKATRQAR